MNILNFFKRMVSIRCSELGTLPLAFPRLSQWVNTNVAPTSVGMENDQLLHAQQSCKPSKGRVYTCH